MFPQSSLNRRLLRLPPQHLHDPVELRQFQSAAHTFLLRRLERAVFEDAASAHVDRFRGRGEHGGDGEPLRGVVCDGALADEQLLGDLRVVERATQLAPEFVVVA